ncbi:MAG: choice-of-anchor D domain-containing protein [Candidatus Dormibacteraeota bacterium]|nr:choice-of-anchor D domain-containing protein [Candidatus Dormibacteraeota bacterium]
MTRFRRAVLIATLALALAPGGALADWPTYHLNAARSGNATAEPTATSISHIWSAGLDGQVYAEPLMVGSMVLIATENNTVYALDAGTGHVLWENNSLGAPVPATSFVCGNIDPVGITGTPVVDTATGTMYVVTTVAQPRLHSELVAIRISDGATLWQQSIAPAGFDPTIQGQRSALALANGYVYVPFGGRAGDCGNYTAWVVGTAANGSGTQHVFSLPNGPSQGSFWATSGPAVDGAGNLYITSGNSQCATGCNPFDYGETIMKLSPDLSTIRDFWTPSNYGALNAGDTDLGSVGPALLNSGLLFQVGKAGDGYLIDSASMGGLGANPKFSLHACPGLTVDAAFGGTAYAPPYIYVPCTDGIEALNVNETTPSFTLAWHGPPTSFAGPPIVAGGLVWTIDPAGTLYGLNPTSGATTFSANIGGAHHFATPTAGAGRIFVPAGTSIEAFTLIPQPALTLNPWQLGFGQQQVGTTSAAQTSTITNSGNAPMTVSTIAASGDFAQTNTCGTLPATLQPGASCTVRVTFTPTAGGTRQGAVLITDNATGSPHQLSLGGYSMPFKAAYTLDGWGGLHPVAGSPAMSGGGFWPNWKIARSAALLPDASGGYTLDGFGGAHQFGAAAPVTAAYFGFDIARDIVLLPTSTRTAPQGYTLDGWGGIHPFGGAPATHGGGYWPNWDIAKRFALLGDGTGGYILDGWGGLHPFAVGSNALPPTITNNGYWPNWNIARDIALTPGSSRTAVSGVTLDGWGGVHPFGSSGAIAGATAFWPNWDIARAVKLANDSTALTPRGWVLDGWGGLHEFGGAPHLPMGGYWPNWDIAVQLALS